MTEARFQEIRKQWVEPSVFAIYELDSNGEADVCHFYCSEKCRRKAEPNFIGTEHAVGDGDSIIKGTLCETCGLEIDKLAEPIDELIAWGQRVREQASNA